VVIEMMNRRDLLEQSGAFFFLAALPQAQGAGQGRAVLFEHDLPDLTLKNWSVTAVEVRYAPGQSSPSHKHPGITIAYVLEGEIRSKVGDGPERVYKVGEMFLETPGQIHAVSGNASTTQPARLLALLLAEKGQTLTTPA
jgi:quercetin dioxygenase-like cupin family protein